MPKNRCGCYHENGDPVKLSRIFGLLDIKAFPCPPFIVCKQQTSPSMTFPEFQSADLNSCSSNKVADAETREDQQPWGRVLVPPQGVHIIVSFELFIELKSPINGRYQRSSFQRRLPEASLKTREVSRDCCHSVPKSCLVLCHPMD